MSLAGACLCGAVRVVAMTDPLTVRQCWCRDCQTLSSGSASVNVFFPSDGVEIDGPLNWFNKVADSGIALSRGFCPTCGTPVAVQSHARRHLMGVHAGVFNDAANLAPRSVIWTSSAPPWACIDPALPHETHQPPPLA